MAIKIQGNTVISDTKLGSFAGIESTKSANSDVLVSLTAAFATAGNRSLTITTPDSDSNTAPFIVSSDNAIDFRVDNISSLLIDSTGNVNSSKLVVTGGSISGISSLGVSGPVSVSNTQVIDASRNATFATITALSPISVASGGTGANNVVDARTNLDVDQAGLALAFSIALG